ncbi:hypothetical protein Ancab_025628 [Ancistrocladus abbreviatus]
MVVKTHHIDPVQVFDYGSHRILALVGEEEVHSKVDCSGQQEWLSVGGAGFFYECKPPLLQKDTEVLHLLSALEELPIEIQSIESVFPSNSNCGVDEALSYVMKVVVKLDSKGLLDSHTVPETQDRAVKIKIPDSKFLAMDIDDDLFIRLILQPETDKTKNGSLTIRVTFRSLFLGNSDRLVSVMSSAFPELGVNKSDCQEMGWAESVLFWSCYDNGTPVDVLLNRTYDLGYLKRKSDYVQDPISKDGLELLWQKLIELGKPGLVFNSYGGKMNQIPACATAFPHRAGNLYKIQRSTTWNVAGEAAESEYLGKIRELYSFMTPLFF